MHILKNNLSMFDEKFQAITRALTSSHDMLKVINLPEREIVNKNYFHALALHSFQIARFSR